MTVQVKCKNCGNLASSDLFKIDYRYGFVVCPVCQKGKVHRKETQESLIGVKKNELPTTGPRKAKPAGWDFEDDLLEKMWAEKQKLKGKFVRLNKDRMRFTCGKCGYAFTFVEDRKPRSCPYCDTELPRI